MSFCTASLRQTGERVDQIDKSHAICRACADGCGWDILVVPCACIRDQDVPGSVPWSPWDRQRSDTLFINSVQKRASSVRGPEAATCPLTDTSVLSSRLLSFFLNTSSSFCWRHADSKLPITNRKLSLCACACFWRTHEDITSPLRSFNCGSGNRTSKTKLKKEEKEAESTLLLAKVKKKKSSYNVLLLLLHKFSFLISFSLL